MTLLEKTIAELEAVIEIAVAELPYADRSYREEKRRIAQLKRDLAFWKGKQAKALITKESA